MNHETPSATEASSEVRLRIHAGREKTHSILAAIQSEILCGAEAHGNT
jgi:hypothetical protein